MPERQPDSPDGCVFNVQRYSLHDGPGIRTVIFLKGCPLRCVWCCNPESQRREPELGLNGEACLGLHDCGLCASQCKSGAIRPGRGGKACIAREACRQCFFCAELCPANALRVYGRPMTVAEALAIAEADAPFYARSGGGITLSGGEPLVQAAFAHRLLQEAKRRRINTCMETCGFAEWTDLEQACRNLDSILFDIKTMDDQKHQSFTGVSNEKILENFRRLCDTFPNLPKRVRTPVIPGFNDTEDDVRAIIAFIRGRSALELELLPYHRFGRPKYQHLGRNHPMGEQVLDPRRIDTLLELAKAC